jgi:cutinase-like protein
LNVSTRQNIRLLGAAALATWALCIAPVPDASAASCPSSQVVFARGTGEPPGVGPVGEAFVNQLRSRVGGKSVGVYAVSYPATDDWPTGLDGIRDAGAHVVSMASQCPNTKMVLGGYSQGAAVMGFVTSDSVPDGVDPATVPKPLQPDVAQHVAAVVLFGVPNVRAMNFLGQPPVVIGPLYAGKTAQLCVPDDPICSDGLEFGAHNAASYQDGVVDQGADFAASRL